RSIESLNASDLFKSAFDFARNLKKSLERAIEANDFTNHQVLYQLLVLIRQCGIRSDPLDGFDKRIRGHDPFSSGPIGVNERAHEFAVQWLREEALDRMNIIDMSEQAEIKRVFFLLRLLVSANKGNCLFNQRLLWV